MVSFLNKIKKKVEAVDLELEEKDGTKKAAEENISDHLQLNVDIYQTSSKIVIYAPIGGVKMEELDVFVESENDVITISGKKEIPKVVKDDEEVKEYLCQECKWGEFYRQVILPQEINISKIESVVENGVLILSLPLLRIQNKGKKRIRIREVDDE